MIISEEGGPVGPAGPTVELINSVASRHHRGAPREP